MIDKKELRRLALEGDFYAIYELLDRQRRSRATE